MAEEKKIADEILSDEELEQVAGGSESEMEGDSQNFKRLNVFSPFVNDHDKDALRAAFASYGIIIEPHGGHWGKKNKYSLGGQDVSRDVAWYHVQTLYNQGVRPHVK